MLCLGHIQPDGDALGSALALAYAIRRAGGRAVVSFDPGPLPFGLPPSLHFLPGAHLLVDPDRLPSGSSRSVRGDHVRHRLGGTARLVGALRRRRGRADLRSSSSITTPAAPRFGTVRLVDGSVAATAEMVAALIDALGVPFDADIATCLYTGLASDTGSFRYAATSSGLASPRRPPARGRRPPRHDQHPAVGHPAHRLPDRPDHGTLATPARGQPHLDLYRRPPTSRRPAPRPKTPRGLSTSSASRGSTRSPSC